MTAEFPKSMDLLKQELTLSREELEELENNYAEYRELAENLVEEIMAFRRLKRESGDLDARSARLNYENYETFMAIHTNAIAISGIRAALKLKRKEVPDGLQDEVEDILSKYLLITF